MKKEKQMKKLKIIGCTLIILGVVSGLNQLRIQASTILPVYRLYNKNTGEHFYTKNIAEKVSLKSAGWQDEGLGWNSASSGAPVYRVYNPNAKGGDHYYTMSKYEAQSLVKNGWRWDNKGQAAFYSGGEVNLYVAYNPNASSGAHNYTISSFEQNSLLKGGWKYGAVAWKTMGQTPKPVPDVKPTLKVRNTTLNIGESWSAKNNFVSATDTRGNAVDFSKVKVIGSVDTTKSGIYTVSYSYEGVTTSATVTVEFVSTVEVKSGGNAWQHQLSEGRNMTQSISSPTGVFLRKGQSITVSSPDYQNLMISLGQQGSYSYLNEGKIVDKQELNLTQKEQKITANNGDSEVWVLNLSEKPTTLKITGGEKLPLFIKGKTTDEAFNEELRKFKNAPFIQISGENAVVNFEYPEVSKVLLKRSTKGLIDYLDKIIQYEYENKGSRKDAKGTAHRFEDRILFETPEESGVYAYATNKYVCFPKSTGAMLALANAVPTESEWGIYHEIGHTFQDSSLLWNKSNVEVTNNIICEDLLKRFGLESRFVTEKTRLDYVVNYLKLPLEERHWDKLPVNDDSTLIAKLGMFQELAIAFGNNFYPRLSQAYRELAYSNQLTDDPQLFIKVASEISNYDLRPFFKQWGFDISDTTNGWFNEKTLKSLDKPIWKNLYDTTDDLKVDQVEEYTVPTVGNTKNLPSYVLGSDEVPEDLETHSVPIASNITDMKGSKFPTTSVEGLENGTSTMDVTLTNAAEVSNSVSLKVKVKAGNSISLFGYRNLEERAVITLQKNTNHLKALTGDNNTTLIDSGSGVAFEVIQYSKTGEKLNDIKVNQNENTEQFVKKLNELSYSEGDYFEIHNYHSNGIQSYKDSVIDLKQSDSKNIETFKIVNNQFVRILAPNVLTKDFTVHVGEEVDAKLVIQTDSPVDNIEFLTPLDTNRGLDGKVRVRITPKSFMGQTFESEIAYHVVHYNDLSLYGYACSEERINFSLQKDKLIRVVKNNQYNSKIDEGEGKAFTYTHYNKDMKLKETDTINKDEKPDRFVSVLNGKRYEEGDFIKIESYGKGRIFSYQSGKTSLDKKDSNLEAWYKISGDELIYLGPIKNE